MTRAEWAELSAKVQSFDVGVAMETVNEAVETRALREWNNLYKVWVYFVCVFV